MMHHPSGTSRGQASDMHIEARELVRMRDYLSLLISDHTGQPYDRVGQGRGLGVNVSVFACRVSG
jgi:ATP-dependent Clp protease protease subunit